MVALDNSDPWVIAWREDNANREVRSRWRRYRIAVLSGQR